MEVIRATEEYQRAGAYYVRIQAMARQHHIPLPEEFDAVMEELHERGVQFAPASGRQYFS